VSDKRAISIGGTSQAHADGDESRVEYENASMRCRITMIAAKAGGIVRFTYADYVSSGIVDVEDIRAKNDLRWK
jgi:hypothetical protein